MKFGDFVAMNVMVSDLPKGNKLTPQKEGKLFSPELAGAPFAVIAEDCIMLILEDSPLGTEIAVEEGVPADRELSFVGRLGCVGLIGSGGLTVEERSAVGYDGSTDTKTGPGFL